MTLPPFARARLVGVLAEFLGDGELPLIAELRLDGMFAEALTSFRATVWLRLSNESPRFGMLWNNVADVSGVGLGDSWFALSAGLE